MGGSGWGQRQLELRLWGQRSREMSRKWGRGFCLVGSLSPDTADLGSKSRSFRKGLRENDGLPP